MMYRAAMTAAALILVFTHGHLLLLGLLAYIWVTALSGTANTAKTRAVAAQHAALVTAVGATNANVTAVTATANAALPGTGGTVTGDLTVTGSLTVDTNLGVHGGSTLVGDSSCSGNFTVGNSLTVDSNLGVHGGSTLVGASSCGGSFSISGGSFMPVGGLGTAPSPPSGTGGSSQYCGNFYSGSGAYNWAYDISLKVDAIIAALQSAQVTS